MHLSFGFGPRPARRLFNERRSVTRDAAPQKALVRFGRSMAGECFVRDVSDGGARLRFDKPAEVPPRFEIKFDKQGSWRSVQVRWRTSTEIGVAFV